MTRHCCDSTVTWLQQPSLRKLFYLYERSVFFYTATYIKTPNRPTIDEYGTTVGVGGIHEDQILKLEEKEKYVDVPCRNDCPRVEMLICDGWNRYSKIYLNLWCFHKDRLRLQTHILHTTAVPSKAQIWSHPIGGTVGSNHSEVVDVHVFCSCKGDLCDEMITRSEESYRARECVCLWSRDLNNEAV